MTTIRSVKRRRGAVVGERRAPAMKVLLAAMLAVATVASASTSSASNAATARIAATNMKVDNEGTAHKLTIQKKIRLAPATPRTQVIMKAATAASCAKAAATHLLSCSSLQIRGGSSYYDDDNGGGDDYYNSRDPYRKDNYSYDDTDRYDDRYAADDYGYDDRGTSRGSSFKSKLPSIGANRSIGVPMLGAGAVLTVLGVSLFFNKTLMRLGNLCFVLGSVLTLGPGRTASYFLQPKKARATGCLMVGIFLVFVGWPVFGIILEAFGLLNLFGNMFPFAMAILKNTPFIGPLLKRDGGRESRRRMDDYYQDDGRYYDGPTNDQAYDDYRGSNNDDDDYRGYY